jgi:hypothetical protein
MRSIENPKPTVVELQKLHQRSLTNEVFLTHQILGTADKGDKTFEQLRTELNERRSETHRLVLQIVGDPMQGVIIPPHGAELMPLPHEKK